MLFKLLYTFMLFYASMHPDIRCKNFPSFLVANWKVACSAFFIHAVQ